MKDDIPYQQIVERLNDMAEEIAVDMIPDGRREGQYWRGDCHGKCSVHVRGARAGLVGFWQGQRATSNGGNLIHLIEIAMGFGSHGEAVRYAKERYLGLSSTEMSDEDRRRWVASQEESKRKAEQRRKESLKKEVRKEETVRSIWHEAVPIKGTLAEVYLNSRSIHLPDWPASLRFHKSLLYPLGGGNRHFPALICGVQGRDRKLNALWRIFLDPETGGKAKLADGESAKIGFGKAAGGAVRLGPVTETLRICEGVETGLAVQLLTKPGASVWAALSTSGMITFEIPDGVKRLEIFADGDRYRQNKKTGGVLKPPGIEAAERLKAKAAHQGIEAVIYPSPEPDDWLDVWQARFKDEHEQRSIEYRN